MNKKIYTTSIFTLNFICSLGFLNADAIQDQQAEENQLEYDRVEKGVEDKNLERQRLRKAREEKEAERNALERKREDDARYQKQLDDQRWNKEHGY